MDTKDKYKEDIKEIGGKVGKSLVTKIATKTGWMSTIAKLILRFWK